MKQGSDKVQGFIEQASSLYVVGTIYYALLVVLALYCHQIVGTDIERISEIHPLLLSSSVALMLVGAVKLSYQWSQKPRSGCSDSEFDLLVISTCAVITYALVIFLTQTTPFSSVTSLLYSFIPTALFVLVAPVTWKKKHRRFIGFFGFLEWSLFLSVVIWSGTILVELFQGGRYIALSSNAFVLLLPLFMKLIRRRHVERLTYDFHREIYIDPLTKISNRKYFYDRYDQIRIKNKNGRLPGEGLGIIFIDIDYFKQYNDKYGHEQGDECLVKVANFLSSVARDNGLSLYRIGGEEFVLMGVFSEDNWQLLMKKPFFEQWRSGELSLDVPHKGAPKGFVTLSAGEDFIEQEKIYELNAVGMLKQADARLYKVKNTSKGRLFSRMEDEQPD